MLEPAQLTLQLLDKMLEILLGLKKPTSATAIEVKNVYSKFLSGVVKTSKEAFLEYYETKDRLDSFLFKLIRSDPRFRSLWTVTQMMLVLSHGQATVKRGFSKNKMLLVENLNMESLIVQQSICVFMKQKCTNLSFPVSKSLTDQVKESCQRYHESLADNTKLKIKTEKNEREMNIVSEIQDINVKVSSLEETIDELQNDADKFAFKAEKKNDISILSKDNTLKRAATDKEGNLSELKIEKSKVDGIKRTFVDVSNYMNMDIIAEFFSSICLLLFCKIVYFCLL